ncbi:MAG: PEP/pyruvate-binding domain-containing protein [Patescibacteria group bacterium]
MMLVFPQQLGEFEAEVGAKTKNLGVLLKHGFCVPKFVAVPTSVVKKFISSEGKINEGEILHLIDELGKNFKCQSYAVRSSALIEDSREYSFAGQFETKIAQPLDKVEQATQDILRQAHKQLHGRMEKFSLIIQEYIEADFSGICFTRHPVQGREMIFEFHRGRGEEVVSGRVTPERLSFYWNQSDVQIPLLGGANFDDFKKIEAIFGSAQDIEWCIQNGQWYFLQSRSITTKTDEEYARDIFLDSALPKNKKFFFEKTEISEIAPRPTSPTLALLKAIYGEGGPVKNVYARYGVTYQSADFLRIVGDELYMDREQEIKTLLPAFSYLSKNDFAPHFIFGRGFWRTIKNLWALQKISMARLQKLQEELRQKLSTKTPGTESFEKAHEDFLKDYETIFEINLLAQKAVKRLEQGVKKETISASAILSEPFDAQIDFSDEGFVGNALEIADETPFGRAKAPPPASRKVREWLARLPAWRSKYFLPIVAAAQQLNAMREFGRCLTVKNVSRLRRALHHKSKKLESYDPHAAAKFPPSLTWKPFIFENQKLVGVSGGKAQGKLIRLEQLNASSAGDFILYTDMLTPDLTQYFGKICGILSQSGGLLSHLAIMAREQHIPVIVGVSLIQQKIALGEMVEMNGDTGNLRKL